MKLIGVFTFLFSFSCFAFNPQIHTCNVTGGRFHALNLGNDQIGTCIYGSAMLDSLSLMQVTSTGEKSMAIQALENGNSCEAASGTALSVSDLEGRGFNVCSFSDSSVIEIQTLNNGSQAASNASLMKAINTRF